MKQLLWSVLLLSLSVGIQASERQKRSFRIAEGSLANAERSPYVLTMISSDLVQYPRAVVTFQVSTDKDRAPSSILPPDSIPERIRARRYYKQLETDHFGRDGETQVVFDRSAHTVYLGFLGKAGRTFYYKEISTELKPEAAVGDGKLGVLQTE